MYTKSNNTEIMMGSNTNEVVEKLFESLLQIYQEYLEEKMRGSEFVFDGVNALYYDLNKISLNRGRSYIDSPKWLKNKKATVNTKKIRHAYISKYDLKRKNQVILLMITDGKKWHYLSVKSLSGLLKGITSKHVRDFYSLNCFHTYFTRNRLENHKIVCENHDYCYLEMPKEDNKILKQSR